MVDNDKPVTDKPVQEPKAEEPKAKEPKAEEPKVKQPKAEEPKTEEPKTEEPASAGPAPAGTDQRGRQLYEIVCASCGKKAQVPFKPSGDRPVYCRDCYMKQRRGGPGRGMGRGPRV